MAITRSTISIEQPQCTPLLSHTSSTTAELNHNPINNNNEQQQQQQQQQPISTESVSNYEQTRELRIKENRERLQKLGIVDLSLQLKSIASTKRTPRNSHRKTPVKSPSLGSTDPPRRSSRLQNAPPVTYTEPKEDKSKKSKDLVLEEGAKPEFYTEEHEKLLGDTEMPWTFFVDGYRADGTRIYDPINGKTCHQCRQKTLGQRTRCCQCDLVRGQFCGDCLLMRYGEHVVEANQNPKWICPPCRGICNCSLCRIAKGWVPTGAIYKRIKNLGFKSVAHYLIMTKRAPPESEVSSDVPQSAKKALPFEGMEITNDDGSDDKAMVVYTEINPQSEFDSTTVVECASSSGDIGRPIMESKPEEIGAAGKSVRKSDESESKPRRVGRPRKRPKKENTDAAEESLRVSAESVRARAGSQKGKIDAGVELGEVIGTAEAEPVSDMNIPNTSTFIANESNSECVRRSTSSSTKENDGLEDSENVATGDEPVFTMEKPNASDSKADILLED